MLGVALLVGDGVVLVGVERLAHRVEPLEALALQHRQQGAVHRLEGDLAIAHGGGEEVKQIWTALFDALEREGLERIDPLRAPFDPTVHDAVAHDPGDGTGEPEVVEVLRAGYRWKGRVLRPAMVKVRG